MAIEDAADAARKGEAKEDAQTGARLKDFPKGEAKEDAQLGVRTAARTGEAKKDAQTGARPKDFPGEATEDAQKGVDEGASRTTRGLAGVWCQMEERVLGVGRRQGGRFSHQRQGEGRSQRPPKK